MNRKSRALLLSLVLIPITGIAGYGVLTRVNPNRQHVIGEQIDALNGVAIYFNGGVNTTQGRNLSQDGYNLGMRYQCVEFVKRYVFERYRHRMPDSYGNARDFFDATLADAGWNAKRAMVQHSNGSVSRPEPDDLVVFRPWIFNPYGHVAIVAAVSDTSIEIAQQNPGPFGSPRETLPLESRDGKWFLRHPRAQGWLRLPQPRTPVSER